MADINDTKTPNVSRNKVDPHKPHSSDTARTADGDGAHRSTTTTTTTHKKSGGSNWLLISAVVLVALLAVAWLFGAFDGETIAVLPVDGGSEEIAAPTDGIATTAPEVIETDTAIAEPEAVIVEEVEETAGPELNQIETDAEVTTVPVTPIE
jgi:hypothetical protein